MGQMRDGRREKRRNNGMGRGRSDEIGKIGEKKNSPTSIKCIRKVIKVEQANKLI